MVRRKPRKSGAALLQGETSQVSVTTPEAVQTSSPTSPIWYIHGTVMPDMKTRQPQLYEMLSLFTNANMSKNFPNYVPTTWEKWESYLEDAKKKEPGQRDLHRVLVAILPNYEGSGSVEVFNHVTGLIIELKSGDLIVVPAVDLPPNVFQQGRQSSFVEIKVSEANMSVYACMCYWERDESKPNIQQPPKRDDTNPTRVIQVPIESPYA